MTDVDINDVFDSIVLAEERISSEGFAEGFTKGGEEGKLEGYHLGYHRGAEIGAEIGYYKGVVTVLEEKSNVYPAGNAEKVANTIKKLKSLLNAFPKNNTQDVDLIASLDEIRSQAKKLSAILKLNFTVPASSKMSF